MEEEVKKRKGKITRGEQDEKIDKAMQIEKKEENRQSWELPPCSRLSNVGDGRSELVESIPCFALLALGLVRGSTLV